MSELPNPRLAVCALECQSPTMACASRCYRMHNMTLADLGGEAKPSNTPRTDELLAHTATLPRHEAVSLLASHALTLESELAEARDLLDMATHALRSYQFGNDSPDLAGSAADKIEAFRRPK